MKKGLYSALLFGLCSMVFAEIPLNFDTENRGKDLGAKAGELEGPFDGNTQNRILQIIAEGSAQNGGEAV